MNSNNFVSLIGRVGQQPTRKNFDNGNAVLEFSLATNRYYKDREGNRAQETQWHRVKTFQPKVIDVLERYVNRGDQISIVGNLRYRDWTDKHDQKHTQAEIIVDSFTFLDNGRRTEPNDSNPINARNPAPANGPRTTYAGTRGSALSTPLVLDAEGPDDLPF